MVAKKQMVQKGYSKADALEDAMRAIWCRLRCQAVGLAGLFQCKNNSYQLFGGMGMATL